MMDEASRATVDRFGDLFDHSVRVEEMWPFPMTPAPERLLEALADALANDRIPEAIKPFFAWMGEDDCEQFSDGGWQAGELFEEVAASAHRKGFYGYIGIAATPVFTPGSGDSRSFSWGHYHTQMMVAETGDGLLDEAIKWARTVQDADCATASEPAA